MLHIVKTAFYVEIHVIFMVGLEDVIENITWPGGDTKFLFECREEEFYISKRPCNVLFIIYKPMKYKTISLQLYFGVKGAIYYEAI